MNFSYVNTIEDYVEAVKITRSINPVSYTHLKIMEIDIDNIDVEYLDYALDFANAAASIVVKRKGALKSMPTKEEINTILEDRLS